MLDKPSKLRWEIARDKFEMDGFDYGDLVSHAWIYAALALEMPHGEMKKRQADDIKREHNLALKELKRDLLVRRKMYLELEQTKGFRIVHRDRQVKAAIALAEKEIMKTVNDSLLIVDNTNIDGFSLIQKEERTDARRNLAWIKSMAKKKLKSPF